MTHLMLTTCIPRDRAVLHTADPEGCMSEREVFQDMCVCTDEAVAANNQDFLDNGMHPQNLDVERGQEDIKRRSCVWW